MHSWQLADFVSKLNIAKNQRMKFINVRATTLNLRLLMLFIECGFIRGFQTVDYNTLQVCLKTEGGFTKISLVSKPSLKIYSNKIRFAKMKERSDSTFFVVSVSGGLVLDSNCFFSNNYGKVLLKIQV